MSLWLALTALGLFSFLVFWKPNAVLFMILAGVSIILGLTWYDLYVTNMGLTMGLMLIAYAIFCIGMAFRLLFWRQDIED